MVAGWLAGQIVQGTGLGVVSDIVFGILGAGLGSWLFPISGGHLGAGLLNAIVNATIGASMLLLIVRELRGRTPARPVRRWRGSRGWRWR